MYGFGGFFGLEERKLCHNQCRVRVPDLFRIGQTLAEESLGVDTRDGPPQKEHDNDPSA